MKKLGVLLVVIFISHYWAVAQKKDELKLFNEKDSVKISGKIIGYKPSQGDYFMTFSVYDLKGKSTNESIQIKDNGDFYIALYQPFEGDVLLNFKDSFFDLYTKPGTSIRLQIDNEKIDDEKGFVAYGQYAAVNNLLFKFKKEFSQQHFQKVDMGDKSQGDSLYAVRKIAQLNKQLAFLKSFVERYQIKDQLFINWQKNDLQYKTGTEVLFYPFAGKFNDKITQVQLLKLIEAIPINNPSAFNNSAYYHFLNMLRTGQEIMININPSYSQAKQTGNFTELQFNEMDKFSTGVTREVMHYNVLLDNTKIAKDPLAYERLTKTVSNPFLKRKLNEKQTKPIHDFSSYAILDRLEKAKVSGALKQNLVNLFTRTKGANWYIDFWGDWCGPCMAEMPSYPKLINAFKGKPLKFLFLSAFTPDESMLAIKKKYGIEAEFVNLTKDEVAILNNVFEFHSYPSHFLVNSQGRVVANTSGRVSEGDIGEKVREFEKILNQK